MLIGVSVVCLWCVRCPLQAVEELFNLMQLFVAQRADMREEELEDIKQFKKTTISCYLRCLDGRSCWTTLIRSVHMHTHTNIHTHTGLLKRYC